MMPNPDVMVLDADGPPLGSETDARDILGEAFGSGAIIIVIPVERLDPQFLHLRSGLAGAFIQKLQQYERRLFIVGDIAAAVAQSTALRDFVVETNRVGRHRFLPDRAALSAALS
jgi:uncharacterized protein DUF4180